MSKTLSLLLLAFLSFPGTSVRAQEATTRGLQKVLNRAFEKGNLMVALSAVEWRPGLALAATQLPTGETSTLELALRKNVNYAFIATSGDEFTDVDLYLLDEQNNVLAQDQETDGTPILEFWVPATGTYQVQVHIPASNNTDNFVALSLLQSAGQSIIEGDYRLLNNRFFTAAMALSQAKKDLSWFKKPGGWSMLGFTVENNAIIDLSNIRFSPGNYQIAGSAGPQFRNLSLYLANREGEIVSQSKAKSPFPFLEFQAFNTQPHLLRIVPKGPQASGLLLLGIFQH